jgi:hypothetical protein
MPEKIAFRKFGQKECGSVWLEVRGCKADGCVEDTAANCTVKYCMRWDTLGVSPRRELTHPFKRSLLRHRCTACKNDEHAVVLSEVAS